MSSPDANSTKSKDTDKKTNVDSESENVHSANKWEKVDMGDDDRKKKFLRLMGASKKEHHGRFIIGDEHVLPHDRESPEKEIEEKLEDQFKQGLEHKLIAGPKAHIGLGFHDDPKKISDNSTASGDSKSKEDENSEKTDEKVGEKTDEKVGEKTDEKVGEKHKLDEKTNSDDVPVKKKMMYNFVKASDS